ncbi:MAG: DegT/DnrJ/EryC1/StrS family aminotransferase [Sporomusaceae bacterium]|nr:DegT/DnrJ/EryC1/StrS family aminotransferase [Sporomusaceae bacterium]
MIPRFRPQLGWEELKAAWFQPLAVDKFENSFAKLMGARNAVAFPYGRTGLALLLRALGIKGKEIICPAYTCVVVPHAIITSGNEPVFVDSRSEDFNADLDAVKYAINENTGAIIATSIFGYPVDLDRLAEIKRKYPQIAIVQDCAHSFGAEWKGKSVVNFGDAAIFGMNVSKLLTSIFGGMVTTNNDKLAERLRCTRSQAIKSPGRWKPFGRRLYLTAVMAAFNKTAYSIVNSLERLGVLNRFVRYYDEGLIDMPEDYLVGLTEAEAAVGNVQIGRYYDIIARRREVAKYYNANLKGFKGLIIPPLIDGATYSHYVIRTRGKEQLIKFGLQHGVQFGQLIEYCIPEMPSYINRSGARFGYSEASLMARTAVNLPLWSSAPNDLELVLHTVKLFSEKLR